MRLLILTCNTGEGHNSCAKAVKEYCESAGEECRIVDSLSFLSEKASRFIAGWHTRLYRKAPGIFDKGYRYAERHDGLLEEGSAVYKLLTTGAKELAAFIQNGKFDAVLCVHIFSALLLGRALAITPMSIRTGLLSTDYTCSPGGNQSGLDFCFIPDEAFLNEFLAAGISKEKIVVTGVPVRQAFFRQPTREVAKESLGVTPEHSHMVMACGSMGCGPMEELAQLLAGQMDDHTELSIVCGTNEKRRERLEKALGQYPNIHIHGFVKDMALLMASCDLYLTKPGGISVSEAAVIGLPMVLINAVAGCEAGNMRFFLQKGAAVTADTPKELAAVSLDLLKDTAQLHHMAEAYGALSMRNGASLIYHSLRK